MSTESDTRARYDGVADWYDVQFESDTTRAAALRANLPTGEGPCLDVGCGTGRQLSVIAEFGWSPVGVELSSDQLRVARSRATDLIREDAERLPFESGVFSMAVSSWTSTDVEHFDAMLAEIARVLRPGGRFLFYGVHPCFNGPQTEWLSDGSRVVHPSYAEARRHTSSPWWSTTGVRARVGGMRHVPLAAFLNAFVDGGLTIDHVGEPGDEPVPHAIIVHATRVAS